jgi:hypothetical protein
VVGSGHYCIIGDSLAHNFQETILMAKIVGSMVKTMKQKFKVGNTLPQSFDALTSSIYIELSNSSSSEDLTPLPSSMELLKGIFQSDASLSIEPSTHVGNIQSIISWLHEIVLPRQTLNKLWTLDYEY